MREILFRAKRIDNKEWVTGLLTVMFGQYHVINPNDENTAYPIDCETVCQHTGVCDMYGNKIFENDIVEFDDELYVIEWDDNDARFILDGDSVIHAFSNIYGYECTVMGNIFDNPELVGR